MQRDVARAELYRGTINLWVEDTLTREYLATVWQDDPNVAFFIGGGNEGVHAIVRDAEKVGFQNVFGLTDRDFGQSNVATWRDPNKRFRTFALPVHEIENYLLVAQALRSSRLHNRNLSVPEIRKLLAAAAGRLCWWAACREVVAELKRRFRHSFVDDPPCSLRSHNAARDHICGSKWFKKLGAMTAKTKVQDIDRLLAASFDKAQRRLANNSWRSHFAGKEILSAGKEILHDIGSRLCDRTQLVKPVTRHDFDINIAKDVADWQVRHRKVPRDLVVLLEVLKARIAPGSPPP
jgi:hypothetical protein